METSRLVVCWSECAVPVRFGGFAGATAGAAESTAANSRTAESDQQSAAAPQTPEQAAQTDLRKAWADEVRKSYNFRFGTDKISTPGNAAIEGNDFIQAGAFPKATYCAVCHAQAYNNWRQA